MLLLVACASDEGSSQTATEPVSDFKTKCMGVDKLAVTYDRNDARRIVAVYTCANGSDVIHAVSLPVEHQQ